MSAEVGLGLLAVFFYGVHAWHYVRLGLPENALWFCHLAALAVGIGWMARAALPIAIGLLWLSVGIPCWLVYLASGGELVLGSILTHIGGAVLGVMGVQRFGWPAGAWWKAILLLVAVHFATRIVTAPGENVNLAFSVWEGSRGLFPSHGVYLAVLTTISAAVFFAVETGFRRFGTPIGVAR